ncbi:MAG: MBL fold metallo-hydrolase [Pseudomonadota bacterium]
MALQVSRILHAGYVFSCEGVDIAFDPVFENPFSRNCHAFPDVRFELDAIRQQRFAAVFISHYHDDHCSFDSLDLLARDTPIYMYCLFEEMFDMLRALGFTHVQQLRTNVTVQLGPFAVTPREALDADVDSMFQVRAGGMNVLNVVDSWIAPEVLTRLAREGPWDMVLWPFQTMRELAVLSPSRHTHADSALPEEFIEQLIELDPRFVVPSSCQFVQEPWSWYNHAMFPITYAQFAREVGAALPRARVLRLDPSVSVLLDARGLSPAPALGWVVPVGPQDLDFDFRPQQSVPHSSEIARHFEALTELESARVIAYCEVGLIEKYHAMDTGEAPYFDEPRRWRLAIYDSHGVARLFDYRVHGGDIALVRADDSEVHWLTEVPAAKIYAALERGESLTSMYMRINDVQFSVETELALAEADVAEDPLMRCLFNGVFGAYQAAQLERLR